uniref:Uncharacterized protein n=1 Tax=Anguilla anguilla TaxID=7936 RepID=A0A0E9VN11_ANGAN
MVMVSTSTSTCCSHKTWVCQMYFCIVGFSCYYSYVAS